MKRHIALFLACLLALSAAACGKSNPSGESEPPSERVTDTAESTETESTESFDPALPALDLQGRTFTFFTKNHSSWDDWQDKSIWVDDTNADPVNDAVYNRNAAIEAEYGIKIAEYAPEYTKFESELTKDITSGTKAYDVALPPLNIAGSLASKGHLVDLKTGAEYMNLDNAWWDPKSVDELSIAHRLYMVSGDISTLNYDATWCTMINLQVLKEQGIASPYTLVSENRWTFDEYKKLCENASEDLNGDGIFNDEDCIANLTQDENALTMPITFGYHLIEKDENDLPVFTLENDERLYSMLKDLNAFMTDTTVSLNYHKYGGKGYHLLTTKMFEENRGLFWITNLQMVIRLRSMETDFGIAPCPKYDDTQENYQNVVLQVGAFTCIPRGAASAAESSYILEAMAAKSREILRPAYYEQALTYKYLRDKESVAMLDLVIDNRTFDLELAYNFGAGTAVSQIVLNGKEPASTFASGKNKIQSNIEKLITSFEKTEEA